MNPLNITLEQALEIVSKFKQGDLKIELNKIKHSLIGKTKKAVKVTPKLFEAGLVIKSDCSN